MTEVISVRFRNGCKTYYFDPHGIEVAAGQSVIVETASGNEFALCTEGNHLVPEQSVVKPLRPLVRVATENDQRTDAYNRNREKDAFAICEKKIAAHKLEMKLIRVESNFDGSKIIFFFTAEGRVDFRELVKDLANVFRARIELRQVGVRDEAKMIGGLGICGRPLCCSQFLDNFMPVSIKMAKTQNLSLNPTKISGTCGRLMCCLKYEQNAYEDAAKRMPKNDSFVNTPDGPGNVCSVDLLREEVKVRLDESPEAPRCYKGCELQILRNGKGSREGIEIPAERPARFVRPEAEREDFFAARFDFVEQPLEEEVAGEQKNTEKREGRSRRRRGGRGRGKDSAAKRENAAKEAAAAAQKEPREKREPKKKSEKAGESVERIPVKASGDLTAEKKAAADRRFGAERRGEKKPQEKRGQKAAAPQGEKAEGVPTSSGGSHRRRRPRRRRSGGGAQEGPKGES